MKKMLLKVIAVMLTFVTMSLAVSSGFSAAEFKQRPEKSKIVEARFVNMLNHSFVYNEDFDSVEKIVNNSVVAVLSQAEDEFVSVEVLNGYLYDMFGFIIEDFSDINKDFPKKDGYVYILPRGYAVYKHDVVSVTENEDGSIKVITDATIGAHDAEAETFHCETMFIKNESSAFGYNIVSSEILF